MTDDTLPVRVTRLEVEVKEARIDIADNREDLKAIRADIYTIKNNELKHYKSGKTYWLKFLGAGSLGVILTELVKRLPEIIRALLG